MDTLKRALYEMFEEVDKSKSGLLGYSEFQDSFKTLSYGLGENDVRTLVALADEEEEEMIAWEKFIPVAIDSIKAFFLRNKAL